MHELIHTELQQQDGLISIDNDKLLVFTDMRTLLQAHMLKCSVSSLRIDGVFYYVLSLTVQGYLSDG
jgi:hypothetical protein